MRVARRELLALLGAPGAKAHVPAREDHGVDLGLHADAAEVAARLLGAEGRAFLGLVDVLQLEAPARYLELLLEDLWRVGLVLLLESDENVRHDFLLPVFQVLLQNQGRNLPF